MIVIISPAKSLNFKSEIPLDESTMPLFREESVALMNELKKLDRGDLKELMSISNKLADLNYNRNQEWTDDYRQGESRQAIFAYDGEVFNGLQARQMDAESIIYAQDHLFILSGLYGALRPLDKIKPYRLEMGIPLETDRASDLYDFWDDKIKNLLMDAFQKHSAKAVVNLASNEYSKAVRLNEWDARIITPSFKELRGEKYKIITSYMKKARGLMSRYIMENKIDQPEDLKAFDVEGYFYNEELSDRDNWVFTR
jgi:hypothetical protein